MDGERFDRLTRALATASSRRGLIRGAVGALAAGLFGGDAAAAARPPRKSSCGGREEGEACGECGVCRNGACVVDPTVRCTGCQLCSPNSFRCRPTDDVCSACEKCEPDGSGFRCRRLHCQADEHCCNHRCDPKERCCTDRDCPECGRCERGRCKPNPAKNGQKCGTSGCTVCQNGQCVNQIDNAGCFDQNGLCCRGVCCAVDQSCCDGVCCPTGRCVAGICCDVGFAAADAALCCPFGPPCGEGANARCCGENQHCCERSGACCDNGATCCGDGCCAAGQTCCDGQCVTGECPCADGKRRCPNDGPCCLRAESCTTEGGCCSILNGVACCVINNATGACAGPCCSHDTEHCCGDEANTDFWCCPKGNACYKGGCCPPDFPFFTAGPGGIYCCPDDLVPPGEEDIYCIKTPVPGRRN